MGAKTLRNHRTNLMNNRYKTTTTVNRIVHLVGILNLDRAMNLHSPNLKANFSLLMLSSSKYSSSNSNNCAKHLEALSLISIDKSINFKEQNPWIKIN